MNKASLTVVVARAPTDFEQVLLGLICRADASGYDLKRAFAATPLTLYQPSSGALYPALRRLERRGLLRTRNAPAGESAARGRRVLEPTAQGRSEHARWIRQPVDPQTISQDFPLHLMRFVMMESLLPPAEILRFLHNLQDALTALIAQLDRYSATAEFTDRHPRLALDHGTAIHRASLAWVQRTIATLNNTPPRSAPPAELQPSASRRARVPPGQRGAQHPPG